METGILACLFKDLTIIQDVVVNNIDVTFVTRLTITKPHARKP